jgi:hypothetical protein
VYGLGKLEHFLDAPLFLLPGMVIVRKLTIDGRGAGFDEVIYEVNINMTLNDDGVSHTELIRRVTVIVFASCRKLTIDGRGAGFDEVIY